MLLQLLQIISAMQASLTPLFSSDFLPQVLLALCDVVAARHAQSHNSGVCPK